MVVGQVPWTGGEDLGGQWGQRPVRGHEAGGTDTVDHSVEGSSAVDHNSTDGCTVVVVHVTVVLHTHTVGAEAQVALGCSCCSKTISDRSKMSFDCSGRRRTADHWPDQSSSQSVAVEGDADSHQEERQGQP